MNCPYAGRVSNCQCSHCTPLQSCTLCRGNGEYYRSDGDLVGCVCNEARLKEENRAKTLSRFRADPKKVRIAICWLRSKQKWLVTIYARQKGPEGSGLPTAWGWSDSPKKAMARALKLAEEGEISGIDLGMGSTYEHPFGRET